MFGSDSKLIADFARRLERERDEAREAAEKAKAFKRVMKEDNAKLRRELTAERALADKLARALDRMLHLHDNGTWSGKRPDERARDVIKKWKEARK